MTGSQKWAEYLKSKDVKRLMDEVRAKWVSYGKLTGKVVLKNVSESERKDISGIICKHYSSKDISVSMKDFEQALLSSAFGETNINEVLDAYFGERVFTSKENKENKQQENEQFYQQLVEILDKQNANQKIYEWLDYAFRCKNNGYLILQRLKKDNYLDIFNSVICGIQRIIVEKEIYTPIAVFASSISGNPHFLDRNRGKGSSLFVVILSYLYQVDYPKDAKSWYELFGMATLSKDEIAGNVAVYNVHFVRDGKYHQGAEECYKYGEVFITSFANLNHVSKATTDTDVVYVVENEMVFLSIQQAIQNTNIGLICTSGQLSVTAYKIMELLDKGNIKIYYSGDLDPEGICICNTLWKDTPELIIPWFMDKKAYEDSMSNEDISGNRLASLGGSNIKNPVLQETAKEVILKGKAGYQENILEQYIEYLLNGEK